MAAILGGLKLSKETAEQIASHISRRDGVCRLSDKALTARSKRSLRSVKRDLYRLKMLGLLIVEYEAVEMSQRSVRLLKIAVPSAQGKGQRIPPSSGPGQGPTYPPYVGPLDIGEPLDV